MKAKQIVVLISILVAEIVLAPAVFAEEAEPFGLDFSKIENIEVSFGEWKGSFLPDGTARLERDRSHIFSWDAATAPKGSFPFEEIYALVAPHLKVESVFKPKECLIITFSFNSFAVKSVMPSHVSFYIEDKQVARTLMHGLRKKTKFQDKAFLEELYSKYPLMPGEDPDSFWYGFKMNIFKWLCGSILSVTSIGAVLWFIRKKKKNMQ